MIYLSVARCEATPVSRHETAHRVLLSLLSDLGYTDAVIKKEPNGRPFTGIEGLDVSISHTSDIVAVCVICERDTDLETAVALPFYGTRVGIDVEEIKRDADISSRQKIANRFLNCEVSTHEEFFRKWTRNESYGKMTGEGVFNRGDTDRTMLSFTLQMNGKDYSLSISFN